MLLQDLYKILRVELSESDARYVLKKRAGLDATDLITNPEAEIDETQILADLKEVRSGKPLSRIYGEREFWGLDFEISAETLDPRQDTETLIEAVLMRYKDNPPETILDIGTGSGCILISLLHELQSAKGIGTDLSDDAINTAKKNAQNLGIGERAQFIETRWADGIDQKFDLIVSNPPYIASDAISNLDENVQKYDPILALDGGEDGLQAYKDIFLQLPELLKEGGSAFFEIGFDQEKSTRRLSEESGFLVQNVHRDSAGNPRVVEIFFE